VERIVDAGGRRIVLATGDLARWPADVVVNAANAALAGGGGVDGAIHAAAGPSVMEELRSSHPGGCPTGGAVLTRAGRLPARWVAHAVGPVWRGGDRGEAGLLGGAYRAALDRADEVGAETVACAAISCGVYGYPLAEAAGVSVGAVRAWLAEHPGTSVREVTWVLRGSDVLRAFEAALASLP
jgi:O-acetyl-ADP-ribose deacetylase (regulator of RNase III)